MVMKATVDSIALVMKLHSPIVLLEIGSATIVNMLKMLVFLVTEDLLVLSLLVDGLHSKKILEYFMVVFLLGLVPHGDLSTGIISLIMKL